MIHLPQRSKICVEKPKNNIIENMVQKMKNELTKFYKMLF